MTILLLGPAHVGKSQLITSFLTGVAPSAPSSSSSISHRSTTASLSASATSASLNSTTPTSRTSAPPSASKDIFLAPYDPTIENAYTIQYIMPHNPAYNAPLSPLPPPPPSAFDPSTPTASSSSFSSTSSSSSQLDSISALIQEFTTQEIYNQNKQRIILTLIDVGGHPLYSHLWPSVIRAADAIMLCYDVADKRSFDAMWGYYRMVIDVRRGASLGSVEVGSVPCLLVGNMVDTISKRPRQVTPDMARSLAKILCAPVLETTARAPQSVSHCFRTLIDETQAKVHASLVLDVNAEDHSGNHMRFSSSSVSGSSMTSCGSTVVFPFPASAYPAALLPKARNASAEKSALVTPTIVGGAERLSVNSTSSTYSSNSASAPEIPSAQSATHANKVGGLRHKRDMIYAAWKALENRRNSADGPRRESCGSLTDGDEGQVKEADQKRRSKDEDVAQRLKAQLRMMGSVLSLKEKQKEHYVPPPLPGGGPANSPTPSASSSASTTATITQRTTTAEDYQDRNQTQTNSPEIIHAQKIKSLEGLMGELQGFVSSSSASSSSTSAPSSNASTPHTSPTLAPGKVAVSKRDLPVLDLDEKLKVGLQLSADKTMASKLIKRAGFAPPPEDDLDPTAPENQGVLDEDQQEELIQNIKASNEESNKVFKRAVTVLACGLAVL
ncbi:hypothetical protein HDV05_001820 [Chytridiales sp. JEL 0842]|nr:hypothetical protein HDV05_001820 [Chytridiales sp. JEL 0842]